MAYIKLLLSVSSVCVKDQTIDISFPDQSVASHLLIRPMAPGKIETAVQESTSKPASNGVAAKVTISILVKTHVVRMRLTSHRTYHLS